VAALGAPKLLIYVCGIGIGLIRGFPFRCGCGDFLCWSLFFTWKPVGWGMIHGSLSNDFSRSRRTCRLFDTQPEPTSSGTLFLDGWLLGLLYSPPKSFSFDSISTVNPSSSPCTWMHTHDGFFASARSFPFATVEVYLDLQKIPDGGKSAFPDRRHSCFTWLH